MSCECFSSAQIMIKFPINFLIEARVGTVSERASNEITAAN